MKNILVFGASGQLGQCIKNVAAEKNITPFFPDESEANILDTDALKRLFEQHRPGWIINCAAYTAVDKAEEEAEIAEKVNKTGAKNLAVLCKEYNAVLIHISTDFVFKGDISRPLKETDAASPISVYGQTKLDGELAVAAALDKHFIIRTGWLYSEYANNFVKTMLRLGSERSELKIIADQVGTPTYAIDLAGFILNIIENNSDAYGTYHYSNEGVTSWFDFARAVFDISGIKVKAIPIRTDEYITKASRPAYSVMDKSKAKQTFGIEIPYWRDSLAICLNRLK
ncbi:dTDP-4-dehydrorhamnose reductase [Mucilaginibacter sp. L3T2-6]|uniref:dTDP-4-dehydrorhamnose reductase n=1 Tax=Mucilaginibacter sp. L3T2-6 TaxID=3062491 RepID=UPI002675D617|nr:dTDP-4-dehydrorhamnose reductase [Mucilaginibacter sp. L3T2-6]MDO3642702.1 dTDP-4-dehydrorhamnose reductase [Mucilaginibacter sp. L3T2-6]MDV6215351.1 dTDP-4-dehydrorhamnose reductase [Mucilaginibacter sp. L3T2-6]